MKKHMYLLIIYFLGLIGMVFGTSQYIAQNGDIPLNVTEEENKLKSTVIYNDKQEEQFSANESKPKEKEIKVTATAYTAYCSGCSGTTATGINLRENPNKKVIAVDPNMIPLGTKVWVEGYGEAVAGDTGSAIKGNKIDVFIPSEKEATEWGVKKINIKILM